jgi:thioredoxin-like negative regulator of GroEL
MSSLRTNVTHVAAGAGPEINDRSTADCSPSWLAGTDPRALAPRLEQLARQFEGQVQVRKLNVDDAPELATAHGVRGIPTLILFKGGQAHSRLVGLHDETQLSSWVRAAL